MKTAKIIGKRSRPIPAVQHKDLDAQLRTGRFSSLARKTSLNQNDDL